MSASTGALTITRRGVALISLPKALSSGVRGDILHGLDRAAKEKAKSVLIVGKSSLCSPMTTISETLRGTHLAYPVLVEVNNAIAKCSIPVVSVMHADCMSAALELSLSCHWRIASETAQVGFPDVSLGLMPYSGGTQLLPRLIGVKRSLDLLLSGSCISAPEAKKWGLLDATIPNMSYKEYLEAAEDYSLSTIVQVLPDSG